MLAKMNIGEEELRNIMGDHTDMESRDYSFYKKLCSMSHRVKAFHQEFCERKPAFEQRFLQRKLDESFQRISLGKVNSKNKMAMFKGTHAVIL